jgi:hypothetical protein
MEGILSSVVPGTGCRSVIVGVHLAMLYENGGDYDLVMSSEYIRKTERCLGI